MDSYQGSIYDPVTLHKYLYANANPVMYTDPSGYEGELREKVVAAGISVILAIAEEAGGKYLRTEDAHEPPNPHNYRHINYTTPWGGKGTIRIK